MSWFITPTPGDASLCAKACKHLDCAQHRREAKWECPLCKKPLGHGAKVTRYGDPDDFGTAPMCHFGCVVRDIGERRATASAKQTLDRFFFGG